jgi:hydroxymethylpyrimidine/phosphomethylpyrimidine kinase
LCWKGRIHEFRVSRVRGAETHGTGCTFSAAVAAFLAKGRSLPQAVEAAQRFVHAALTNSVPVGKHRALGWWLTSSR